MISRKATEDDKYEFVVLVKKFLKESKYPFSLDVNLLIENFEQAVVHPDFGVFVLEEEGELVGMLVGAASTPLFSTDKISTELAWYIDKDHRDKKHSLSLLEDYESWAASIGCKFVTMVDIHSLQDLSTLYERKGYTLTEKTYVKEI